MKKTLLLSLSLTLSGCVGIPTKTDENIATSKIISFPAEGKEHTVSVGQSIHLFLDYKSSFKAYPEGRIMARVGLGRVDIAPDDELIKSRLNGKEMLCTSKRTYIDPLTGPFSIACGIDSSNSGFIDTVTAAPGLIWFEAKLDHKVKYREVETASNLNGALKREIAFDGYDGKNLLVTYREFKSNLTQADTVQPLSFRITEIPMPIEIKGLQLLVKNITPSEVTYLVKQSWKSTLDSTAPL